MIPKEEGKEVYNNFDHVQRLSDEELKKSGKRHQHAAWNFCGYVHYDEDKYKEDVWQYGTLIETLEGTSIMDVVTQANDKYGSE